MERRTERLVAESARNQDTLRCPYSCIASVHLNEMRTKSNGNDGLALYYPDCIYARAVLSRGLKDPTKFRFRVERPVAR